MNPDDDAPKQKPDRKISRFQQVRQMINAENKEARNDEITRVLERRINKEMVENGKPNHKENMKQKIQQSMNWTDDNEKQFDALYGAVINQRWQQSLNNIRMKGFLNKDASRKSHRHSKSGLRRSRTRTSRRY
jgi:hypothetical protein